MTRIKLLLLLVASFSVMFIGLITLGAYYWAHNQKSTALICCLLGFVSALGQFFSLALLLREHATRVQYPHRPQATAAAPNTAQPTDHTHDSSD